MAANFVTESSIRRKPLRPNTFPSQMEGNGGLFGRHFATDYTSVANICDELVVRHKCEQNGGHFGRHFVTAILAAIL